ncbi:MAG: dipeptidase [Frankiales bacterium]|nr:dipeptidase [Frankiales bacterium]
MSPPEIAPHSARTAVDVTLRGPDGELDLGSPVNAGPGQSGGRCFTRSPDVTGPARHLREVLAAALTAAGLVDHPTEWWHWSYGDRYWALQTGAPAALHGPVGPPSRVS